MDNDITQDPEHRLTPRLRFPEFRHAGEWKEKELGQLSNIARGGSPRPIENFITRNAKGLNWLKIGDVDKESKYITHTEERVIQSALTKTREVYPGDLIMSNSMSFGRPFILQIKCCIHDGWIAITEIDKEIQSDYLYYWILTSSSQLYFSNAAGGGGIKNLNAEIVKQLPIKFPKIREQKKISDCLSYLDDLIALQSQKLDALKTYKKGLLQHLFPTEGESVPPLRFPQFQDAGEWETVTLDSKVSKVGSGITPLGGDTNYKKTGIPFIRSQNVGWGELLLDEVVFIDDATHATFSATEIKERDVLLNITGASIGRSAVADSRITGGNVNQHVCIIRCIPEKLNPEFLNQFLISPYGQRQIDSFQAGGNRQGLNFAQIRSFEVPLPKNLDEQSNIASFLTVIDNLIASQKQKTDSLIIYKKGLLQQLFPAIDKEQE